VPDDLRRFTEGLALERPLLGPSAIYREVCRIARARGEQAPGYHTIYNVIRAIPDLKTLALDGEKAYREAYNLVHRREAERPNQSGKPTTPSSISGPSEPTAKQDGRG
jgi:putative transposase